MTLHDLIVELSKRNPDTIVKHGFGDGHSDRGDYSNAAFTPIKETSIGQMLHHAMLLLNTEQDGWNGGRYSMYGYVEANIGEWGKCGEPITTHHFLYWDTFAKDEV
jgi:hypothetical protein